MDLTVLTYRDVILVAVKVCLVLGLGLSVGWLLREAWYAIKAWREARRAFKDPAAFEPAIPSPITVQRSELARIDHDLNNIKMGVTHQIDMECNKLRGELADLRAKTQQWHATTTKWLTDWDKANRDILNAKQDKLSDDDKFVRDAEMSNQIVRIAQHAVRKELEKTCSNSCGKCIETVVFEAKGRRKSERKGEQRGDGRRRPKKT